MRLGAALVAALTIAVALLAPLGESGGGAEPYAPQLLIRGDGETWFDVVFLNLTTHFARDAADTAEVDLYLPHGFTLDTTIAPGTKIGQTSTPPNGEVEVVEAATVTPTACSREPHAALWRLAVAAGLAPVYEVFVAVRPAVGAETGFAAYRLKICRPPPTQEPGVLPARVLHFRVDHVIRPPAGTGEHVWRAVFRPTKRPSGSTPAPVESRSLVKLPVRVSLSATRLVETVVRSGRRTRVPKVLISGQVTEGGAVPAQGGFDEGGGGRYGLELYRARTRDDRRCCFIGILRVGQSGRTRATVRDRNGRYYRARTISVTYGPRTAPPSLCARPWLAAGGCVRPTLWDFVVSSPVVEAR